MSTEKGGRVQREVERRGRMITEEGSGAQRREDENRVERMSTETSTAREDKHSEGGQAQRERMSTYAGGRAQMREEEH